MDSRNRRPGRAANNIYADSNDVVYIDALEHPRDVSSFLSCVQNHRKRGNDPVFMDGGRAGRIFPNACVPVAAIVHYFKSRGIDFVVDPISRMLEIAHLLDPLTPDTSTLKSSPDCLSRVWQFRTDQQIADLVSLYADTINEKIECQAGVIDAFSWALNEVMDNVLMHAETTLGFVMVQIHEVSQRVAICISDTGIGLMGSLRNTIHSPRRAVDAITLAVREGVTRDTGIGQGNGLWGLLSLISANRGMLTITSGRGSVFYRDGCDIQTFDRIPCLAGC